MYKIPGYAGAGTTVVEAKESGDHITADHVVLRRDSKNVIEEARLALVIKDVATSFMYAYPSALKSEEECHLALIHFVSHKDSVGQSYSDNAQELIKVSNRSAGAMSYRRLMSISPMQLPNVPYVQQRKAQGRTCFRQDCLTCTGLRRWSMHVLCSILITPMALSIPPGSSASELCSQVRFCHSDVE